MINCINKSSPQAEFNPGEFQGFTVVLLQKLKLFLKLEEDEEEDGSMIMEDGDGSIGSLGDTYLEEKVILTSFHPWWRDGENDLDAEEYPFPIIIVWSLVSLR